MAWNSPAPEPITDDDGKTWCPEPDCNRGPGGSGGPLKSSVAYRGHYQRHAAERRREEQAEARRTAAERGEPVTPIRKGTRSKQPPLNDRLAASFGAIGAGLQVLPITPVAVKADGASLVNHARELADAWADVAAENETMRRAAELLAGGGAWGAFLFVLITISLEVGANHGWLKVPTQQAPAQPDPEAMLRAFGITPEMADRFAAEMFGGRQPLRPEGADPGLTGPGEVRVA